MLLALIADEDICVGFLLGGIGEIDKNQDANFLVVDKKKTTAEEIEESFRHFLQRPDIDIILIQQNYADMIRPALDEHSQALPAVLEIPSKEHPYDVTKDSILRRARGFFDPEEMRIV